MPARKHRARIAKSRASKMWMESLEQRQLWAPIGGDFTPLVAGDAVIVSSRLTESGPAAWVSDTPRDLAAARNDDDTPGSVNSVLVMVL